MNDNQITIESRLAAIQKRYLFVLYGALLSIGSPLGWMVIVNNFPQYNIDTYLYMYMWLGTTVAFAGFGFFLGLMYDRLKKSAMIDPLTGLWNHKALLDFAQVLLNINERNDDPLTLMVIDIDRFKYVNDHHDHIFGSFVLQEVARIIQQCARKADVVGRYGGDEFIVCLPNTTSDEALVIAERIRNEVQSATFTHGRYSCKITISIGVAAMCHKTAESLMALIKSADNALYQAKSAGRNRVCQAAGLEDDAIVRERIA